MVVALQLTGLPMASTVQVVAGRPDPLVLPLVSWALSMANEKPLVTSANVSVPPVKLPLASRLPVKLSTNSSEPCIDFDTLTVVAVKLVAELVNQKASANVPWKLNRITWPEAALAGPAKASTVNAVTDSPISARLISFRPFSAYEAVGLPRGLQGLIWHEAAANPGHRTAGRLGRRRTSQGWHSAGPGSAPVRPGQTPWPAG